jgi:sortase B
MATNKKKTKAKNTRIAAVCAIVAIVAAGGAGTAFALKNHSAEEIQDPQVSTEVRTAAPEENSNAVDPAQVSNGIVNGMTARAMTIRDHYNADYVGWVTVPNTEVDYPIVVGEDNSYYLNHGFDHKEYEPGTIFMDYRDRFGFDETEQSENIILYGHNRADKTMFGSLRVYRQDLDFYHDAPFIELESNYKKYTYVIFALPIADGKATADWRFWDTEELDSQQAFDDFVQNARERSLVDIPVDVKYGDKLVTLSTCYSDADDSRFLVIGRRLRPGETAESFAKAFARE